METNNDGLDGLAKFLGDQMRKLRRLLNNESEEVFYRNNKVVLPTRSWGYWMGLPAYAHMYILPAYKGVCDTESMVNFLHRFLGEWQETSNPAKRLCIETVVFPLYRDWTGRNFDANLIAL